MTDPTSGSPSSHAAGLRLPAPSPAKAVVLLAAFSLPVLFMGLDQYPVVNADEAFYHDVAWTMLETGDWWKVRTGPGEHVYDTFANAPLQYWARGLVISLIGPGLFGMRILSALSGLLAVLATYALALRVAGRAAGLLAGLLLLTNYQFVYLHAARTGELETGVALLLVLLALLFLRAAQQPRAGFVAHHLLFVLLIGWKAPVAPIPLLAEGVCFALVPAVRPRLGAWLRTGVAVLPLALVWHGYQAWRLREVVPAVWDAVAVQAAGGSVVPSVAGRVFFYIERAWFGAWPQIALLPAALVALWSRARQATQAGSEARLRETGSADATAIRVIGLYLAAVLIFYCAISKVGPWYVVHAHPFVAVLVAMALADLQQRARVSVAVGALLAFGVATMAIVAPPLFDFDPFSASAIRIAMPVGTHGLGAVATVVAIGVTASVVGAAMFWGARRAGSMQAVVAGIAACVVAVSVARVAWPLRDLARTSPGHALHVDLAGRREAGAPIPFPVEVPPIHPWIAHYYFGHSFELQPASARPGDPGPPWRRFALTGDRS